MPSPDRNRPYQEPQDIDLEFDLKDVERKSFDLQDGNYLVELRELAPREPEDKSRKTYLWSEWEIIAAEKPEHEHSVGIKITCVFSLAKTAEWKIANMMDALYGHQMEGKQIPKEAVGKRCAVFIGRESYDKGDGHGARERSQIKKFKSADRFAGTAPAGNGVSTSKISGKEEVAV